MKDIPVIRGYKYISSLVAEGEHVHQDFKFSISDARKIARSISAFANREGGRLLVGVKDNGTLAGVRNEEDIFVLEQAAERYCDPPQTLEFKAYRVDTATIIISAYTAPSDIRPVRVLEADGSARAYYRVADENIVAHPLMVRAWLRRSAGEGMSYSLDPAGERLIAFLQQNGDGVAIDDIAAAVGMSRRLTHNLIVDLAVASLVEFVYRAPNFLVLLA